MKLFAHLDGNNFYVSCHRVFDPKLFKRPVIVLSNNDGCAVARSEEAKSLGINMGTPHFKCAHLEQEADLVSLSANFALYGEMSQRMMELASSLGVSQEIYSIDECFIDLSGVREVTRRAHAIRSRILRGIGIPTCIGIGPSKTLAKLANHVAKDSERKPGSYPAHLARVCNLAELSSSELQHILELTTAGDIWGVGARYATRLDELGIKTAWQLRNMPLPMARTHFGVVLERTVCELQGISCIPMEFAPPPKQQIACTRSFGRPVTELEPLLEAVSHFAQRAGEKLRQQDHRAGAVHVFAHSSRFRHNEEPFSRQATVQLSKPSSDTSALVYAAMMGIRKIYEPGYRLAKAGVILMDLSPKEQEQESLLELASLQVRDRSALMETVDNINKRYGKGTIGVGCAVKGGVWRMRQEHVTPVYTADVEFMPHCS